MPKCKYKIIHVSLGGGSDYYELKQKEITALAPEGWTYVESISAGGSSFNILMLFMRSIGY